MAPGGTTAEQPVHRDARGPLAGVRVLEACEGIAGPFAGWLLAEMGCDVAKLEEPGGDPLRAAAAFHVLNRSKRAVVAPSDAALDALCARADVVLVDRPAPARAAAGGALARVARAPRPPSQIRCRVSGLGERGSLCDLPADDGLAAAAAGISAMQWSHEPGPTYLTTPVTAYACGMTTALGAIAALRARVAHGGQEVGASQLAAGLLFQSGTYVTGPQSQGSLAMRANDPRGVIPTYSFYRAADDWLFVGALTDVFWAKLCTAIDRPELLAHPELQGGPLSFTFPPERRLLVRRTLEEIFAARPRAEWLRVLAEHDVPAAPVESRADFLRDAQSERMGMRVRVDDPLLGPTEQMGLPLGFDATPGAITRPAPRLGEHTLEVLRAWCGAAVASSILDGTGPFDGSDPLDGGDLAGDRSGDPSASGRAPSDAPPDAPPDVPAAPLRGWSDDPRHPRNLARAALPPAPLDGVRVLDLATFIAGALCPMLLADLGAEVIKVEPPGGDPFRVGTTFGFLGWNRGTRSLSLDLQRPEGRDALLRLVERADLLVDNYRVGVLARLGLGDDVLRARNPRLIHVAITGYGPSGPLADRPCFDPIMQGRSGLSRAQGGDEPVMYSVAYTDYATATLAAVGAVAALYARDCAGGAPGRADAAGQTVDASLLRSAFAMQAGFFIDYPGRPADPPGGRAVRGTSALHRAYAARDGWLFLAAREPGAAARLLDALGAAPGPGVGAAPTGAPGAAPTAALGATAAGESGAAPIADDASVDGPLARRIAAALAAVDRERALATLRAAGIAAVACDPFPAIADAPHQRDNELWWRADHAELGPVVQTGAALELERTPMRLGPVAPRLGEHSIEVLREAGFSGAEIDQLLASGALTAR